MVVREKGIGRNQEGLPINSFPLLYFRVLESNNDI